LNLTCGGGIFGSAFLHFLIIIAIIIRIITPPGITVERIIVYIGKSLVDVAISGTP